MLALCSSAVHAGRPLALAASEEALVATSLSLRDGVNIVNSFKSHEEIRYVLL